MSEIALLSSRAVIVGVVHITLVVHIRPVSPTGARQGVKISGNKGNKGKPWGHCKQTTFKTFNMNYECEN